VTFYGVLWAAASTDLIAVFFKMSLNHVLTVMQIMLIAGPVAAYIITKRTCLALQRKDREIVLHGRETGRIVRLPHGEYIEVHEPLDKFEMYKLVDFKDYRPTVVRPNKYGKITVGTRLRAALSRVYFEDRIAPVTQTELNEAQSHDHSPAVSAPAAQDQLTK
jgi:ubiquinol-cytochrome c reductase cytochrome b subunit